MPSTSPLEKRRARIRRIRTTVAAGAAGIFVAVFGFLFGQLSSGGDPGLNHNTTASSSTTADNQSATADDSAVQSEELDSGQTQLPAQSQSSSSAQSWSTPSPAPVQTTQS